MIIDRVCTGYVAENCFIVLKNGTLYIIDPGADAPAIIKKIDDEFQGYEQLEILFTHAHADHIGAAGALVHQLKPAAVHLACEDEKIYRSSDNAFPPWIPLAENLPETAPYKDNGNYKVIRCPGHTPGGVSLLFEEDGHKHLFSGDTLFAGSIGRTDFEGGSMEQLMQTLQMLAGNLSDDTIVHPGHGEDTSIGREKKNNIYLKQ